MNAHVESEIVVFTWPYICKDEKYADQSTLLPMISIDDPQVSHHRLRLSSLCLSACAMPRSAAFCAPDAVALRVAFHMYRTKEPPPGELSRIRVKPEAPLRIL